MHARSHFWLLVLSGFAGLTGTAAAQELKVCVPVSCQPPVVGPLPQTYRMILTDAKNPDWMLREFACEVPKTARTGIGD